MSTLRINNYLNSIVLNAVALLLLGIIAWNLVGAESLANLTDIGRGAISPEEQLRIALDESNISIYHFSSR